MSATPKHPPFNAVPAFSDATDTEEKAKKLAATIRAAWAACNHDVECVIRNEGREKFPLWTVRMPGLVNGLPVRR